VTLWGLLEWHALLPRGWLTWHACTIQVGSLLLHVVSPIIPTATIIKSMTAALCPIIPLIIACIHFIMASVFWHGSDLLIWLLQVRAGCYVAAAKLLIQKFTVPSFKQQRTRMMHAAACNLQQWHSRHVCYNTVPWVSVELLST